MTPRLTLLDVYDELACAGGAALGLIPDLTNIEETRAVPGAGENQLLLTLPRLSPAWPLLLERRVLRATFNDGSFDEWRIARIEEEAREDGGLASRVVALWPEADLAAATIIGRSEADGTVNYDFAIDAITIAKHLSSVILPSLAGVGATWFAAGTIDPTVPVPLVYSWTTPLDACLQLAAGVSKATGGRCEFQVRRNGATNYLLDFVNQIGSGAARLYIQVGTNLKNVQRKRDAVPQAIRAYGRGTPEDGFYPTIGDALWQVASAPTGSTLRLVDPNGGDGPILEDDQLNGTALRKWPSGPWLSVTDSAKLNHEVTTFIFHSIIAGDLVQFAADAAGLNLTNLSSPSAAAAYVKSGTPLPHKVVDRPDLPGTVNLVTNPAMRLYTTGSNAAPDGWQVIPGCGLSVNSVDKDTTDNRWRSGGASAKVVTTADGHGIECGWSPIGPTDRRGLASGFMGYWCDTDAGRVRVHLVLGKATAAISSMSRATAGGITTVTVNTTAAHGLAIGDLVDLAGISGGTTADGYNGIRRVSAIVDTDTFEVQLTADPGTISLSTATFRPVQVYKATPSQGAKFWNDLGYQNADAKAFAATVAKVQVMQEGATGLTMYVDRAQITLGSGEGQRPFFEGSGPTQLWQALNRFIAENAPPAAEYQANVLDLARLDPDRWANLDIAVGGAVDVDDQRWALDVSTRVLLRTRTLVGPDGDLAVASILLSSKAPDYTDSAIRRPRATRPPAAAPMGPRKIRTIRFEGSALQPKTAADAANLSHQLYLGANFGLYPTTTSAGSASADIGQSLRDRGAMKIVGFRSDLQVITAGTGTLKLFRDDTQIALLTAAGGYTALSDTTLAQAIGKERYRVEATLQQTSSTIFPFLTWFELDVEVDEPA